MKITTMTFLKGMDRVEGGILENFLISLRTWQSCIPHESFLAIESEGPEDETPKHASALCDKYGVIPIIVCPRKDDKYWNKCRGLNHCIRYSNEHSDIIMQLDVDMILHPDHMAIAADRFDSGGRILYQGTNRALVEPITVTAARGQEAADQWEQLIPKSRYVPTGDELEEPRHSNPYDIDGPPSKAHGPCQAAHRAWWFYIRGYDEVINGWGADDADIVRRASLTGRSIVWAPDDIHMFHQKHPRLWQDVSEEEKEERMQHNLRNRIHSYRKFHHKAFRRNRTGWGGC